MITPLFFDIETVAHPDVEQWVEVEEPNLDEIKAPSNYKDEAKIKEYIERKRQEALEKAMEQYQAKIDKAALDPDLGMIRAIAMAPDAFAEPEVILAPEDMSEPDLLKEFWYRMSNTMGRCCGYNILGFDLPFVLRRSFELAVTPSVKVSLARYRTDPVTDLYAILYNWGPGKRLKWVCERYGIDIPAGADVDGSMVAEMDAEQLREYVASDVVVVQALYERMRGIYF